MFNKEMKFDKDMIIPVVLTNYAHVYKPKETLLFSTDLSFLEQEDRSKTISDFEERKEEFSALKEFNYIFTLYERRHSSRYKSGLNLFYFSETPTEIYNQIFEKCQMGIDWKKSTLIVVRKLDLESGNIYEVMLDTSTIRYAEKLDNDISDFWKTDRDWCDKAKMVREENGFITELDANDDKYYVLLDSPREIAEKIINSFKME